MPVEEQELCIVPKPAAPWVYVVVYSAKISAVETAIGNQVVHRESPLRTADEFDALRKFIDSYLAGAINAIPGKSIITNIVLLYRD